MLESFLKLNVPDDGWRIIAVDNASTDKTKEILLKYSNQLPIQYVYEEKKGKNNALNEAIKHIDSDDLIVFTDDDIIPSRDWLVKLLSCANKNIDYTIFGGNIVPYWPRVPEAWILELVPLGVTYALTRSNTLEGDIFPGLIWGPNMAVRRSVFDEGYRFNGDIGPNGENYVMGSETDFTIRLHKDGYKSWFCKEASVQHIIRERQMEADWIIARAFRFGRNMYRQESTSYGSNVAFFMGIPRWMFNKQLRQYLRLVISKFTRDKRESFSSKWEISFFKGYFTESRMESKKS